VESDSPESRPSVDDFSEIVDEFAYHTQIAFSEADRSMTREESELRERYSALLASLQDARQQRNLSPSDQHRLDEELAIVNSNRLRVRDSLGIHHSWQEAHDELHHLDSLRESVQFQKELNRYGRGTALTTLLDLVETEARAAEAGQVDSTESGQTEVAAAARSSPPISSAASDSANGALAKDLRSLKECLEAIRQGNGAVAFDRMRKTFDDAFYRIDKRTLNEVDGAWRRAVALEQWLDGLVKTRRDAIWKR